MNTEKYITVEGVYKDKLIEAVQAMSNLYGNVEYSKGIEIYKSDISQDSYVINFAINPDFERFKYFVNYLHYPEVEDYKAMVRGYWTIDESDGLQNKHLNQRVMLYVSDSDKEGDNVHATFERATKAVKLGFALGEEYEELSNLEFHLEENKPKGTDFSSLKTINPDPVAVKKAGKGCLLTIAFLLAIAAMMLIN